MSRATFANFYKLSLAPTPPGSSDEETDSDSSESVRVLFSDRADLPPIDLEQFFSRTVPWDIMCAVIAHLDFETLQTMSRVARDHHQECAKYLWKNFTISIGQGYHASEEAARMYINQSVAVLFSRDYTKWVRGLDIYIGTSLGKENDPLVEGSIQRIFALLQKVTGLLQLNFSTFHHQSRCVGLFSGVNIVPNLTQISVRFGSFRVGTALDTFWRTHPNLRSVEWDGYTDLPTANLPFLSTLRIQFGSQATILRGNPVEELCIQALHDRDCSALIENIRGSPSQNTMVAFNATPCDNPARAFVYTVVLRHLPNLRSVSIVHTTMPNKEDRDTALHVLSTLRRIEVIEWGASNFQLPEEEYDDVKDDFFRTCSQACKLLRKVTLHLYDAFPLVFVRNDPGSPWLRIPYKAPEE